MNIVTDKMKYAPIALFVYDRLWHTQQTIKALQANSGAAKSSLYIFSDAPKDDSTRVEVAEIRTYLRDITGFKSISIIEREKNFGLANSIIDGVTMMCNEYGRVIVLEDDLVTSPYFLSYMNDGLNYYRADKNVASVHGYCYPLNLNNTDTFFLRGADCWGWATWSRAWNIFEPNGQKLLNDLNRKNLNYEFDLDGAYSYTKMLEDQVKGKNDSWAVRWHASCFLENMLTLYPGKSLVKNIGNDGTGTHCSITNSFDVDFPDVQVNVKRISCVEDTIARDKVAQFFRKERNLIRRIFQALKLRIFKIFLRK